MSVAWIQSEFPDLQNVQPLSSGGQKQVFSCVHPTDGDVVIKLIPPPADFEGIQRELLAVRQIGSARVPRVHEHGRRSTPLGECFWIREQRIHGLTLRDILQVGPETPDDVLRLGLQMLEVLRDAEAQRIVHRDVKPDNIIRDAHGDYWLLDFGIARHLQLTSLTPSHSAFGKFTLGYAPPEQFRNVKTEIDGRADLFALGVTLIEAATGVNPFRAGARDPLEVIRRVETLALPPLALPFDSTGTFRDFVDAATQKRRDHRPRNIAEALHWIQSVPVAIGGTP